MHFSCRWNQRWCNWHVFPTSHCNIWSNGLMNDWYHMKLSKQEGTVDHLLRLICLLCISFGFICFDFTLTKATNIVFLCCIPLFSLLFSFNTSCICQVEICGIPKLILNKKSQYKQFTISNINRHSDKVETKSFF